MMEKEIGEKKIEIPLRFLQPVDSFLGNQIDRPTQIDKGLDRLWKDGWVSVY